MAGYTNGYSQPQSTYQYPQQQLYNPDAESVNGNGVGNGHGNQNGRVTPKQANGTNGHQNGNGNGHGNGNGNGHGNGNGNVNGNGNGNLNGASAPQTATKVQPLLCSGHTRPVTHLQFSNLLEDNTYLLISACKDGRPMLRSWLGDWIGTFQGHKGAVWSSKISLDNSRAVTGSADFSAKIWDIASGEALHSFAHNHIVRTVALNPQQTPQYLLTGGNEKKIRLFDLGRPDAEPLVLGQNPDGFSCEGTIRSIVWDEGQGGTVGVSAAEDGLVRWWDLRTLTQTATLDLGQPITSMELAHGGGTLSVTSGSSVHFLDILRQHPPVSIALPHPPTSASLHPYARDRFVVGSTLDPWVRVYDLDSGKQREVYKGHHGPVLCVSYSPDGEVYASGSEDGTIRLWQTSPGKSYGLWQTQE